MAVVYLVTYILMAANASLASAPNGHGIDHGIDCAIARIIPTIYAEKGRQAKKDRDCDQVQMFGKTCGHAPRRCRKPATTADGHCENCISQIFGKEIENIQRERSGARSGKREPGPHQT